MRLRIEHRTVYDFSLPQQRIIQLLRMTPQSFEGQSVLDWQIEADCDARLKNRRDGYGNDVTMLYVDGPIDRIAITVWGEVLTEDRAGMLRGESEPLPPETFLRASPLSVGNAAIADFAKEVVAGHDDEDALSRMHALCGALHRRMTFDTGQTDPYRTAVDAFADGRGVCQDFAHIFCAASRALGHPARYVSGHLWRGQGHEEQAAAHAWAEVHLAGYGWIGFDAANGMCPNAAYVRVAVGMDYRDAAPIAGARVGAGAEKMAVEVAVSDAFGSWQGLGQSQSQHGDRGQDQSQ